MIMNSSLSYLGITLTLAMAQFQYSRTIHLNNSIICDIDSVSVTTTMRKKNRHAEHVDISRHFFFALAMHSEAFHSSGEATKKKTGSNVGEILLSSVFITSREPRAGRMIYWFLSGILFVFFLCLLFYTVAVFHIEV